MKFKIIISILLIGFCILCLKQHISCQYHEAEIDEYRMEMTDRNIELSYLYREIEYLNGREISDAENKIGTIKALFSDVEGNLNRLGYPELRQRIETIEALFDEENKE